MQQDWLKTPLGEALLQQESRVVEEALDGIFGEHCLQLGLWGDSRTFLRFTRTQRCLSIAETPEGEPSAVAELHRLPVESDSMDAVLLPHTLDYSDRPHAILLAMLPLDIKIYGYKELVCTNEPSIAIQTAFSSSKNGRLSWPCSFFYRLWPKRTNKRGQRKQKCSSDHALSRYSTSDA